MEMTRDIAILRDLAKRYMEIALSEKHVRMRQRFRDTNDLNIVRPPLIIEEIPWAQMNIDGELDCICEHEEFRGTEYFFRERLFREKYLACDNYIEPFFPVWKSFIRRFTHRSSQRTLKSTHIILKKRRICSAIP